jgi:hypothetical protein
MKFFIQSIFLFFKNRVTEIIYFLTNVLKKKESIMLLIFVIVFTFIDRQTSKKIKFQKTKAPNILWRIIGLVLYLPLWVEYLYPRFMFFAQRTDPFNITLNHPFSDYINDFLSFTDKIESLLNDKVLFIGIYSVFLYFSSRILIKLVPKKIFYLPMYIRYHMILISLLLLIFPILNGSYKIIAGLRPDINQQFLEITLKDEGFAIISSFYLFLFYLFIIGNFTWKACRGKSFTNIEGTIDRLIQTHLSSDSLYEKETWGEYGMDELDSYKNYF